METPAPYNHGAPVQPHRGIMILVFGILGLTSCLILGILAWVFGNQDLAAMDAGSMDPAGRGMTQAGRVLGIISVCWLAFVLVIALIIGVVIGFSGLTSMSH